MSVIYRPHRGGLDEAMKLKREVDSFNDLQKFIVKELEQWIKLKPEEVVASGEKHNDERIGWKDSDYLCIDSYDKINDKEGYERFFGWKYYHPQCIGMFATDYEV